MYVPILFRDFLDILHLVQSMVPRDNHHLQNKNLCSHTNHICTQLSKIQHNFHKAQLLFCIDTNTLNKVNILGAIFFWLQKGSTV